MTSNSTSDLSNYYNNISMRFFSRGVRKPQHPKIDIPPYDCKNDVRLTATLSIAPWLIPHDDKKTKGGEDSYFISADGTVIGVFDGVGGWSEIGIDPKIYSYTLSEECRKAVDKEFLTDPLDILKFGFSKTNGIPGSCTACIVAINGKQLEAINVGDSGFRVIRNFEVVYASKEQQHAFNTPFQLGMDSNDLPENGDRYNFNLMDGDYVLLGTDGVFDNLDNNAIIQALKTHTQDLSQQNPKQAIQKVVEGIATEAYTLSHSTTIQSPFAVMCKKKGYYYEGGKQDDISVVLIRYNEMHSKL